MDFEELKRAVRGLDAPAGTIAQENAAIKAFHEFLDVVGMTKNSLDDISIAYATEASSPLQNMYSLLTAFGIYLQTKKSTKSRSSEGLLSKATALGYYSQVVNLLREKYAHTLIDSKRIGKIRDKMGAAIEERNLRCNVQTNDASGYKLNDLRVLVSATLETNNSANGMRSVHDAAILTMMWHTLDRAIDTCFARKTQLSIASSGELFLRVARIKTSVVQGLSIYKVAEHWQQCVLHAFDMLFVCASEPSEYIFPLIPRSAVSDLPGESSYSQEEAILYL